MADPQPLNLTGRLEGASAAKLVPNLAAAATGQGLKASAPVPGTLMLSRSFRPPWVAVVVILMVLFTVGSAVGGAGAATIIWVAGAVAAVAFGRQTETVSLVITDEGGGADVAATGTAGGELLEFVTAIVPAWSAV